MLLNIDRNEPDLLRITNKQRTSTCQKEGVVYDQELQLIPTSVSLEIESKVTKQPDLVKT